MIRLSVLSMSKQRQYLELGYLSRQRWYLSCIGLSAVLMSRPKVLSCIGLSTAVIKLGSSLTRDETEKTKIKDTTRRKLSRVKDLT